jgi:hypothetical protein
MAAGCLRVEQWTSVDGDRRSIIKLKLGFEVGVATSSIDDFEYRSFWRGHGRLDDGMNVRLRDRDAVGTADEFGGQCRRRKEAGRLGIKKGR